MALLKWVGSASPPPSVAFNRATNSWPSGVAARRLISGRSARRNSSRGCSPGLHGLMARHGDEPRGVGLQVLLPDRRLARHRRMDAALEIALVRSHLAGMCDLHRELAAAQVVDPSAFETESILGRRISHGAEHFVGHGELAAEVVARGAELDSFERPEVVRPIVQPDQPELGRRRPALADVEADAEPILVRLRGLPAMRGSVSASVGNWPSPPAVRCTRSR